MNEIYPSYKRLQTNIDKAVSNARVFEELDKHYKYLHSLLVKRESDEDIFNDTYLKLTYNYNPERDFIDLFIYYFNLLKGAYYRADKVFNYYVGVSEAYDIPDCTPEIDDTPKATKKTFAQLKLDIYNALPEKTYKRAKKGSKLS